MKRKICYFSISIAALLIISIFPNMQSISTTLDYETSQINISEEEQLLDTEPIMFKIYHIKGKGCSQLTKKSLTKAEINSLIDELKIADSEDKDATLTEIFEGKFNILKKYNLIPNGVTLEDIIKTKEFPSDYELVFGKDFNATTAPIFFVGGGLGIGLGFPFLITAGTFLVAIIGFGLTFCYDIHQNILYQLLCLPFPILIGYLSGFVGLLLIPVVPGFIYSNFFAIGAVAKTSWIQLLA